MKFLKISFFLALSLQAWTAGTEGTVTMFTCGPLTAKLEGFGRPETIKIAMVVFKIKENIIQYLLVTSRNMNPSSEVMVPKGPDPRKIAIEETQTNTGLRKEDYDIVNDKPIQMTAETSEKERISHLYLAKLTKVLPETNKYDWKKKWEATGILEDQLGEDQDAVTNLKVNLWIIESVIQECLSESPEKNVPIQPSFEYITGIIQIEGEVTMKDYNEQNFRGPRLLPWVKECWADYDPKDPDQRKELNIDIGPVKYIKGYKYSWCKLLGETDTTYQYMTKVNDMINRINIQDFPKIGTIHKTFNDALKSINSITERLKKTPELKSIMHHICGEMDDARNRAFALAYNHYKKLSEIRNK